MSIFNWFLPPSFASYNKRSAYNLSFPFCSLIVPGATPIETVTGSPFTFSSFPTRSSNCLTFARSPLLLFITAANSSPPYLPTTASSPKTSLIYSPSVCKTTSPCSCPCMSFIALKVSISIITINLFGSLFASSISLRI